MKTQIVIHILPREIDQCYRLIHDLKRASYLLGDDKIILDLTLNLSDHYTDWGNSQLPKEFFIEKFKYIENVSTFENQFKISHELTGINSVRRNALREAPSDVTHFLWVDVDMFINQTCLYMALEAAKNIQDEYHIVSAELIQGWDPSWDVISSPLTRNTPRIYHEDGRADRSKSLWGTTDPYKMYMENNLTKETSIRQINTIKFGGGLFNLFSGNLLRLIDIPDSFTHYGLDDTFVMMGSQIMKQLGYNINQYVMENVNVLEDHWYRENVYDKFLAFPDYNQIKNDFKSVAHKAWPHELKQLQTKLYNYKNENI